MRNLGIFKKIFFYTLLLLIFVIVTAAFLFSQQFALSFDASQFQQLNAVFQPLARAIAGKNEEEVIEIASAFHEKNQSFSFSIQTMDETVIYSTPGMVKSTQQTLVMTLQQGLLLRVVGVLTGTDTVKTLTSRIISALVILLAAGTVGAALFARGITKPIRRLAEDTHKMAELKDVPRSLYGKDEIGRLGGDVYNMYEKLKHTITALENEIDRVRKMEEKQRSFFSAASHELKTPIAAATVMVEGMLGDIGDYKNHPKYLRECMKTLNAQGKTISEIIEIVSLSDGMVLPLPEKVNIYELINEILPKYYTLAESKGQKIAVTVAENTNCYADKSWLGRAISNILMNAVQNSPPNENIRIWSNDNHDSFTLCLLNTGVTIDKEIMGKLFEPFFRADQARSSNSGRNGLGLTIVKKLLDVMEIPFSLENTDEGVLFAMEIKKTSQ